MFDFFSFRQNITRQCNVGKIKLTSIYISLLSLLKYAVLMLHFGQINWRHIIFDQAIMYNYTKLISVDFIVVTLLMSY